MLTNILFASFDKTDHVHKFFGVAWMGGVTYVCTVGVAAHIPVEKCLERLKYNITWKSGTVPRVWQTGAGVVTLFKMENQRVCADYMGISLLRLSGNTAGHTNHICNYNGQDIKAIHGGECIQFGWLRSASLLFCR